MNERIGMDAFEGAGQRQGGADLAAASLGGRETEDRPQAFSAREETVTHRLVNGGGRRRCFRQKSIQGTVHLFLAGDEVGLQFHRTGNLKLLSSLAMKKAPSPDAFAFPSELIAQHDVMPAGRDLMENVDAGRDQFLPMGDAGVVDDEVNGN